MAYDHLSTKAKDTSRYELHLLLFGGAEPGDAFPFPATLRHALCLLGLEGKFLIKLKAWKNK